MTYCNPNCYCARRGYLIAGCAGAAPERPVGMNPSLAAPYDQDDSLLKVATATTEGLGRMEKIITGMAQTEAAKVFYTCEGKGGRYELLGYARGAGTRSMDDSLAIYRCVGSGQLFFRAEADFDERMERCA